MSKSDVVSVHSNLTPDKHKMIRAEHLALMKPSAYFVNIARGGAGGSGGTGEGVTGTANRGGGIGCVRGRTAAADDPLTKLDNVLLTPHLAPATLDVWTAGGLQICPMYLESGTGQGVTECD